MRKLLMVIFLLGMAFTAKAQQSDCLKDFDFLVRKIVSDYPGYADKVRPDTKQGLEQLEAELRNKIQLYPDSCGKYLAAYASWFNDNHLRVRKLYSNQSSGVSNSSGPSVYKGLIDSLKLAAMDGQTVEGIWHSFGGDIAIFKTSESGEYLGVSLSLRNCVKSQIVCALEKLPDEDYDLTTYPDYNDYEALNSKASLHLDGKVLEWHDDTRFVRKSNSSTLDNAFLYSYLPEYPNGVNTYALALSLSDSTFYLRIPSFSNDVSEKLIRKHWSEISCRPNLIVDIRNNGGGQDGYYQLLSYLIYSGPYESKGVEWYATESNIKMFEQALANGDITNGDEGVQWTNILLNEMKKNVGGFVIHPLMGRDQTVVNDTVFKYPARVGIIINERDASSAEQFLLSAMESEKVILFGNTHTAGVLDYSNAISEDLPSGKYELIFPMTRSRRLPDYPIDNIGISPQVIIPYPATEQLFDRIDSWVYFVKNYLELMPAESR